MRRVLFALMLAVFTTACDNTTGPNSANLVGTYDLRTVNNQSLPFVLANDFEGKIEITSGYVTLRSDRTFVDVSTYRITEPGQAPYFFPAEGSGTYELNGNTVTFYANDSEGSYQYTMTVDGNNRLRQQVTDDLGTFTFMYER